MLATSIVFAVSISAFASEGWLVDFEKAKAEATAQKKAILMDFTGSDWCTWCIRLRKEVFDTQNFKKAAPKDFVLLELDYPQDQAKVPEAIREQNEKLQQIYAITGYPTILLADAAGRPFARTGYEKGGPEEYLKHLDELKKNLEKRDAAFTKAAAVAGIEKAKALKEGLDVVPEEMVAAHYKSTLDEIKALDTTDSLGFEAKFGFVQAMRDHRANLKSKLEQGGEAVRAEADKFVSEHPKLSAKQKQQALLDVLNFLMPPKDNATALKLAEDVKALDPESEEGKMAEKIRAQVEKMSGK
ncbi:MAG: Thioredoxin-related protein [Verrucomicrobia bacterium]|nr:MAG: Thioredoxin-related protein [Verrucomicrobiota bacterium]